MELYLQVSTRVLPVIVDTIAENPVLFKKVIQEIKEALACNEEVIENYIQTSEQLQAPLIELLESVSNAKEVTHPQGAF